MSFVVLIFLLFPKRVQANIARTTKLMKTRIATIWTIRSKHPRASCIPKQPERRVKRRQSATSILFRQHEIAFLFFRDPCYSSATSSHISVLANAFLPTNLSRLGILVTTVPLQHSESEGGPIHPNGYR